MKIAFVSTILHFPWGGADTLWTRAAEAAVARGDTVLLAIAASTAAHPRIAALRAAGALVFERALPGPDRWSDRLRRKCGFPLDAEAPLNAALARFRPDLVVINQGGTYDLLLQPRLIASLQAAGTPFRVIANWQQENPSLPAAEIAVIRTVLEAAQAVFFVSTRNLAVTRRHLRTALPRARVVHNPLRWQPGDAPPWPDEGPARLATVSRFAEGKGLHLLLHALAGLGPALPAWRLTLHGEGPEEASLRALTAWLGLEERVRFAGHVASLPAIWSGHELLCSPALDEGVPMTIPEAMLCSRPALATCVGGAEDWLRDGETGFLCPAPTVPLLAAALQRAFSVRACWAAMGRAAAAAAQAHYRPGDFQLLIS